MKIRINDLARELEVRAKAILDILPEVGVIEKKTHSGSIEEDEAERIRRFFSARSSSPPAVNPSTERRPQIDLSKISKPGDVARLLREREQQRYQTSAFPRRPVYLAPPLLETGQPPVHKPLMPPPATPALYVSKPPAPVVPRPQPPPARPPIAPTPAQSQGRQSHQVAAAAVSMAKASEAFPFMQDEKLKSIAERDNAELKKVVAVEAVKSRFLLMGSLLETLLMDALLPLAQKAHATEKASNYFRKRKSDSIDRWPLSLLIDVSVELDIVERAVKQLSHSVREFRNLIHPGHERRVGYKVRAKEADILERILYLVATDLEEAYYKRLNKG
jgi:hypothetical protein